MTKTEIQDVLTDAMMEINQLADRAFHRGDRKEMHLLETVNNRLVYLWGDLDND